MKILWFKRKRYGWGWRPATWQGWAVIAFYVALIVASVFIFDMRRNPDGALAFSAGVLILSAVLAVIACKTGEPPRWQWGEPEDDGKDSSGK